MLLPQLASAIPLNGLSLRLVPIENHSEILVAAKTIEVTKNDNSIHTKWFALARVPVEGQDYPTFKIKTDQGVLQVDRLAGKAGFLHPNLWSKGSTNLAESLPLWVAPEFLTLEGHATEKFNIGFINISPSVLQAVPDRYYEQLLFFQNLYDHYFQGYTLNKDAHIAKPDQKELKDFSADFFSLGLIAKTKAQLVVNKESKSVDARILGNSYFQLVVLDDPANPLVLSLRIMSDKAPRVFAKNFEFLKNNFEFQVTQVSY